MNPANRKCNHFQDKGLTSSGKSVLASCLAQIVQEHAGLARLIEAWPTVPEQIKAKVKGMVEKHSERRVGDGED